MSDTVRQKIIQNVIDHLQEIRGSNNYNTDIGRRIACGMPDIDPDSLECIVVWPLPEDVEIATKRYGYTTRTFPLTLVGLKNFDPQQAWEVAEIMLGDLIYAMTYPGDGQDAAAKNPTGGLAENVIYTGGGTDQYPEAGQTIIGVSAVFNITYTTKKGDPFNQ